VVEHNPRIAVLNLSGNPLPDKDSKYSLSFIANLLRFIEIENSRLVDLDLSSMNLKNRMEKLQWAIKHSKSLLAVHLSNNELTPPVMADLLMVFGIRMNKYKQSFTANKKALPY
jgi:hypothetical protein